VLAAQARLGLNLADEGFLWYGTIRTAQGDVPIRDFQSYEPGRYYWGAIWTRLLGEGLVAHRISNALFAAVGLTFGLLTLRRANRNWFFTAAIGLMLAVWLFPRHKVFEPALAMIAVYFAARLVENPSPLTCFASGIFAGLTTFFG